jgi:hypothetical protein
MKTDKLNKILLVILWLLIAILTTCFWCNTQFGFNIFSGAHWRYLSYMQASQTPIKTSFYLSIIISGMIILIGSYMLVHPQIKSIRIAFLKRKSKKTPPPHEQNATPVINTIAPDTPVRPQRLSNTPTAPISPQPGTITPASTPVNTPATTMPNISRGMPAPESPDTPQILDIFENAKYTIKPSPRIHGFTVPVFAIGTNETVYIGASSVAPERIIDAVSALQQVFSDTLDNIDINIHGFVVNPTAPAPTESILTFESVEELRKYMSEHENQPAQDPENFEAFSMYISTVIDYIGKI